MGNLKKFKTYKNYEYHERKARGKSRALRLETELSLKEAEKDTDYLNALLGIKTKTF